MGNQKRNKTEREADLVVIADLYRRGWSQSRIAQELSQRRSYSLSQVTIKNDLDLVFKRWKAKQSKYIDNFKTAQLEQLQALKAEAWSEYLRSKKPLKKLREKRSVNAAFGIKPIRKDEDLVDIELDAIFDDSTAELVATEESGLADIEIQFTDLSESFADVEQNVELSESIGNPKFLELIAKLMEQEAKLLGFYKTDNIAPSAQVVVVNMPKPVSKNKFILGDNTFDDE